MTYSVDKFILICPNFIHQPQMDVFARRKAVNDKSSQIVFRLSGKPDNRSQSTFQL